jgi:hypothetical protein
MKDGVLDAGQHQRLHATAPAGPKNNHIGFDIGRLTDDRGGDVVASVGASRLRDESGGTRSWRS